MFLLPLVSLIFIPVLARALPGPIPIGVPVNIVDFQGNVFDLANLNSNALNPNAPVQGLNHVVGDIAQQWVINEVNVESQLFTIANPKVGTFLSYSTAAIGGNPISSQLFGSSKNATQWIISAGNFGYGIIEPSSQDIVTSWPRQSTNTTNLGSSTPLTLQPFQDVIQHVFNFQTLRRI
ncbi:hypothetical protein B0H19DRAFT_1247723 [Mycena capillaripes]|nr:hypothetical protein B0H19DRAFT_1247723 [Mycena capillaripes]